MQYIVLWLEHGTWKNPSVINSSFSSPSWTCTFLTPLFHLTYLKQQRCVRFLAVFCWVPSFLVQGRAIGGSVVQGALPLQLSSFLASTQLKWGLEKAPMFIWARVDQLLVLGMGDLQPLINRESLYNYGYINPYYWVDDHPLLYGNIGSLDPSTYKQ